MIYIILPVHNRKNITEKFIQCLIKQPYQDFKLLLIDDGSSDGTDEMVKDKVPEDKLTIIKGSGDWWWAGSLQQGVNWLKKNKTHSSDIILMINDDVVFESNFLVNAVSFLKKESESLLLARLFNEKKNAVEESGVKADLKHMTFSIAEKPEDINCLSTRGLFMRWGILQRIGGFHPILLPHYGSDYEFTIRAKRKGIRLMTTEDVYLSPDHSTTGLHSLENIQNIKGIFSKRYVRNPLYWTVFIVLTAPVKWIPMNVVKAWFVVIRFLRKN